MNNNKDISDSKANNSSDVNSHQNKLIAIGEKLKNARESMNITESDIINRIKIPKNYLNAIESGNWSVIPNIIYTKAYVRDYARIVKLEIENEIPKEKFIHTNNSQTIRNTLALADSEKHISTQFGQWRKKSVLLAIFITLALIVAFAILFLGTDNDLVKDLQKKLFAEQDETSKNINNDSNSVTKTLPELSNLSTSDEDVNKNRSVELSPLLIKKVDESASTLPSFSINEYVTLTKSTVDNIDTNIDTITTDKIQTHNTKNLLIITSTTKSWIRVSKTYGNVLFETTISPSKPFKKKVTPPFSLVIGNAKSATASFSNKNLSLTKRLTINGNARLFIK